MISEFFLKAGGLFLAVGGIALCLSVIFYFFGL